MYNEEWKKNYIDKVNRKKKLPMYYFENLFRKTELFEEEFNHDLYDFSYLEIEEMYSRLRETKIDKLNNDHSQLKLYVDFCMINGLIKDGQNHFCDISYNDLEKYINKLAVDRKILSREDIDIIQNKAHNYYDKFVIEALFCGLWQGNCIDISQANLKGIDKINMMYYSGNIINVPITNRFITFAEEAAKEESYVGYSTPTMKVSKFIPSEFGTILRDLQLNADPDKKWKRVRLKISNFLKSINMDYLILNDFVISGKIHEIKKYIKIYGMDEKEAYLEYYNIRNIEPKEYVGKFLMKYKNYI